MIHHCLTCHITGNWNCWHYCSSTLLL